MARFTKKRRAIEALGDAIVAAGKVLTPEQIGNVFAMNLYQWGRAEVHGDWSRHDEAQALKPRAAKAGQ
jgi:hypothetical protein